MKRNFFGIVALIASVTLLTFIFQNCAGMSNDVSEQSSTSEQQNTAGKINYNCQNESVTNSPLSKTLQINSGDTMYCEFELLNSDVVVQSKNSATGQIDRENPYSISELKTFGWSEGLTKSGKKGLIYRWQPEFLTTNKFTSTVFASATDSTVLEQVEVTFLPPTKLGLGCMIKGVSSSLSKNFSIRAGQTLYCEIDNYAGVTGYTQELATSIYDRPSPVSIEVYSWKPGKKLNGQSGYVFESVVSASVINRARGYFFLKLPSTDIISDYIEITFTP